MHGNFFSICKDTNYFSNSQIILSEGGNDGCIEQAKVFEKIIFDPQVIADLVCEFPSTKELAQAMMERYNVTKEQALFAILLPFHETPLYFNKQEYYRHIERLKTLRRILQEVRDVKDE